jgi:hypothetical protein
LNGLILWATDVGNAYLESHTKEKIVFRAGPEFGEREGHLMKVVKALYGLKTSGARWHDRLADVLREMGFFPSRADADIWMRAQADHYEYIAVYVDDLAVASKDPGKITNELIEKHKFKLKGTGEITYHLGCDYFRDSTGTLCTSPRTYVDKMVDAYERMFGTKPRLTYASPIEQNDHPELDTSEFLDMDGIRKYQSMIGALQWIVTIGRFDITTAVMTMSSFRVAPRVGHMERLKRMYGYLARMKFGTIRFRTDEPDFSDLTHRTYDWAQSVYGHVSEVIPKDTPKPLGKRVITTTMFDANLMHDVITGRSVTGVLHFLNKTPIEGYSKKQASVETSTYGSEFTAAKTAVQQIVELRLMLRYLGVPVYDKCYLFGDNEAVVKNSTIPHSQLTKRHNALAYHFVREAIASGMIVMEHIRGEENAADILSKHWAYSKIWPLLKPLLFYEGDTSKILLEEATKPKQGKKQSSVPSLNKQEGSK